MDCEYHGNLYLSRGHCTLISNKSRVEYIAKERMHDFNIM